MWVCTGIRLDNYALLTRQIQGKDIISSAHGEISCKLMHVNHILLILIAAQLLSLSLLWHTAKVNIITMEILIAREKIDEITFAFASWTTL